MPTSPMIIPTPLMRITNTFLPVVLQLVALLAMVPVCIYLYAWTFVLNFRQIISATPLAPRDPTLPEGWISLDCITLVCLIVPMIGPAV